MRIWSKPQFLFVASGHLVKITLVFKLLHMGIGLKPHFKNICCVWSFGHLVKTALAKIVLVIWSKIALLELYMGIWSKPHFKKLYMGIWSNSTLKKIKNCIWMGIWSKPHFLYCCISAFGQNRTFKKKKLLDIGIWSNPYFSAANILTCSVPRN